MKEKIYGCIFGGAIGDALGYPIEFIDPVNIEDEIGKYNPKGIISDDTQMSLFTANGLLWGITRARTKGISPDIVDCIYFAYKDWYNTQSFDKSKKDNYISWLSKIKELNVERAPGNTCLSALSGNIKGTLKNPINNSKGCGGIMRIAPIGLFFNPSQFDKHNIGMIGAKSSAITHGHELGNAPSYIFTLIINNILYENMEIEDAINDSVKLFNEKYKYINDENKQYLNDIIRKALELSKLNVNDKDCINKIGEGWVAEEALAIAIYSSLKYAKDFKKAIICSINHKGDSDSTGAITGNIVGVYLGINNIPKYYIDNIELKNILSEIAEDLYINYPKETNYEWDLKYLYRKYKEID